MSRALRLAATSASLLTAVLISQPRAFAQSDWESDLSLNTAYSDPTIGTYGMTNIPVSRNYNDIKAFMQKLAADHPKTVQLFNLAQSDNGDMIVGAKIGDGNPNNVRHLLVSTHHGNEYGSTEVAKAFAFSVAEAPIPGITMYVIPVLNLSGYNQRNRYETNASGEEVDPNRDYPGPCGTEGPYKLRSTHALAQMIEQENIVGSATLHTFQPAVVYPWGISTHDLETAYDDTFKNLVNAATVESHYQVGRNTEVIYPADGAYEDYAYWQLGIWSILFELGSTHTPSDNQVHQMQAVNVPGMRRMFQQTPTQRAANHAFTGRCDTRLRIFDKHEE